ncbi:MAG: AMP-binding protein [Bifidobacteriaceae bacterium]|nr:AMP-binding protein [Bifidobacteriaceae bacterium]
MSRLSRLRPGPGEVIGQLGRGLAAFGVVDHPWRLWRMLAGAGPRYGLTPAAAVLGAGLVWGDGARLTDDAGRLGYRGLAAGCRGLAAALGPLAGARVALMLPDDRSFLVGLGAVCLSGARVTPVGPRTGTDHLRALGQQGFDLVLYADRLAEQASLLGGWRSVPVSQWAGLVAALPDGAPVPRLARQSGLVMLTGGSTGAPKAIGLRRRWLAPLTALGLAGVTAVRPGSVTLICPPLYHGYALAAAMLCLVGGSDMVLAGAVGGNGGELKGLGEGDIGRGEELFQAICRFQVETVFAVPAQLRRLAAYLRAVGPARDAGERVRAVLSGADRLDAATVATLTERWGPVVANYYGTTETGTVTVARSAMCARFPETVGRPVVGTRVQVVDAAGRVLPRGEVGLIRLSSPLASISDDGAGQSVTGTWTTADLGLVTPNGHLTVLGRADGLSRSGGEFGQPEVVREVLLALGGVTAAEVWVEADAVFGQRLAARVCGAGRSEQELKALVRRRLGPANVPGRIQLS